MYHKTEAEQIFHAKMLIDADKILRANKVPSILTNSALLGIYRDGNLIPWSMGVLLSTFYCDIAPKGGILLKAFRKAGFKISKYWTGKNYKIRLKKGKFNVEIVGYQKGVKWHYRELSNKKKVIPIQYLDPPYRKLKFHGYKFIVPRDIEGLLTFLYGNWQTPIMSKSPGAYKTKEHMRHE